jgi:hypothetical protein
MRFGRLLLAGLTALAAYSYAQTAPKPAAHESFRLFQAVVPLLAHAADSISSAPVIQSTAHAVFSLDALAATPLCGSLFLVASLFAINLLLRRHPRNLLRC